VARLWGLALPQETPGYGDDHSVKNSEFVTAFGQYNRLFTDRFYAGLQVSYNYDGIADLTYRVTVTPLAGYYQIKSANTSLAFEVGPAAVFEKYQDQAEDTYMGIRYRRQSAQGALVGASSR
jgi:hypothetical protein